MKSHIKPTHIEKNESFYDFFRNYNPIASSLQALLNQMPWDKDYIDDEPIEVSVMLNPAFLPFINFRSLETKFSGSVSTRYENGTVTYLLNNKKASPTELKSFFDQDMKNMKRVQEAKTKLLKKAASLLTLHDQGIKTLTRFKKDKKLLNAMNNGKQILDFKLTKKEIVSFVKENKNLLLYVSKKKNIVPLIHKQAQNSHLDPIAFNTYHAQGQNIDILYTESSCPDPSWFNNTRYTIIDDTAGVGGDHAKIDGDILRYGANQAHLYCGDLYNSRDSEFNNVPENVDVESYSWGTDKADVDNEYDSTDAALDNHIYTSRNTVCVSAGNIYPHYANTKYVSSPGKALNAITVGASQRDNHTIYDFSSWHNADTMNEKPEVVAVGVVWDKHLKSGMKGTSQATPHVAALVADYMSMLGENWYHRTIGLKALVMASATENIKERKNNTSDLSVGVGGVQFASNNWQIWEMFDGSSDSFTRTFYVPQSAIDAGKSLSVVLTWLNKGDYTIAHKGHDKISIDLDLMVEGPADANKRIVTWSDSYDNPYEVVDFKPNTAGNYTITVSTYAYRDKSSYKKMGLAAVLH